jgi:hypothetical protein
MLEEVHDERHVEIGDAEVSGGPADSLLRETEEQPEGVAIGGDSVRARTSLALQAVAEERLEQGRQRRHGCAPRHGATRWAASSSSRGVAVRYQ